MAGLAYHLRGDADPLEAAAEQQRQRAGQHTECHAEPQPEVLTAGDPGHHPLGAGQEDVIVCSAVGQYPAVLRVGVDREADGEADSAPQDAHPDGRHRAAVQKA